MSNDAKTELPQVIPLQFVGIPNVKTTYRGDGILCRIDHPKSCLIDVAPLKAKQLLEDFPKEWRITGNATQAQHFAKLLRDLPAPKEESLGAAVRSIKGAAKILLADGTQIVLPAGSKVTIEASGR